MADSINILISSDNHLGHLETDPLRHSDPFRTFEELLQLALANKVDCLLLAGNLFHHKKPSHATLVRTIRLLRRYCLSPTNKPRLTVRSDPARVNFAEPCNPVAVPVFVVHGDRDAPAGAGPHAFGPLDVLAHAGLVTYLGRNEAPRGVEVAPILLQKGRTALALYALGYLRDDTLSRAAQAQGGNVLTWLRPEVPTASGDIAYRASPHNNGAVNQQTDTPVDQSWFNLFVLHQNRVAAGSPHGLADSTVLPSWMDYVVWGHEHESKPNIDSSQPAVVQPGSTVATTLSEGEAQPKHAILLQVSVHDGVTNRPVPLHTVRDMHFEHVSLPIHSGATDANPASLMRLLEDKISQVVASQEACFDRKIASFRDGTSAAIVNQVVYPPRSFYVDQLSESPRQPLVHLRVETNGMWDPPNPRRFAKKFQGRVASARELVSFRTTLRRSVPLSESPVQGNMSAAGEREPGALLQPVADEQEVVGIPKLVQYFLYHPQAGGTGLKFFEFDKFSGAVDKFVRNGNGTQNDVIGKQVDDFLNEKQKIALSEVTEADHKLDETELREKFEKGAKEAANRTLEDSTQSHRNGRRNEAMADAGDNPAGAEDEDMIERGEERDDHVRLNETIEEMLGPLHARLSKEPKLATDLSKLSIGNAKKNVKPQMPSSKRNSKTGSKNSSMPVPEKVLVICLDDSDNEDIEKDRHIEQRKMSRKRSVTTSPTAARLRELDSTGTKDTHNMDVEEVDVEEEEDVIMEGPAPGSRKSFRKSRSEGYRRADSGQHSPVKNTEIPATIPRRSPRENKPSFRARESTGDGGHIQRMSRKRPAEDPATGAAHRKRPTTYSGVGVGEGNVEAVDLSAFLSDRIAREQKGDGSDNTESLKNETRVQSKATSMERIPRLPNSREANGGPTTGDSAGHVKRNNEGMKVDLTNEDPSVDPQQGAGANGTGGGGNRVKRPLPPFQPTGPRQSRK